MLTCENKVCRLKTEAITLGVLIEQDLAEQLCASVRFIYLHFQRFTLCEAHQRELMRIESESRVIPREGLKILSHLYQLHGKLHGLSAAVLSKQYTVCQDLLRLISCASSPRLL